MPTSNEIHWQNFYLVRPVGVLYSILVAFTYHLSWLLSLKWSVTNLFPDVFISWQLMNITETRLLGSEKNW